MWSLVITKRADKVCALCQCGFPTSVEQRGDPGTSALVWQPAASSTHPLPRVLEHQRVVH